jgi:uncharacterized membrane protein (DUF373 family)
MPQDQEDPEDRVRPPGLGRGGTRALEVAENVVYGGIAVFLVLSAVLLLAIAAKTTWGLLDDFTATPLLEGLDVLLLVFIVVELLFALRTTVEKRELVAEPFLVVGIIASIKEIVVLSVEAAGVAGEGAPVRRPHGRDRRPRRARRPPWWHGLAVAAQEREPDEGKAAGPEPRTADGRRARGQRERAA